MVRCASVRKKGSLSQCEAAALRGHTLCGRHARSRTPVLWSVVHSSTGRSVEKVQALARGWLLRHRLSLAGPGVLKRSGLTNDEDLFTCESKDRQDPLEYFAFEEAGKVWWFAFSPFWQWCVRSHAPANPYTKVPLSPETRQRLWDCWSLRLRRRHVLPDEPTTYTDRLHYRWNVLSQLFFGFGFEGVHPANFVDLTKADYVSMFILLRPDLEVVLPERDPFRDRALLLCKRNVNTATVLPQGQYILQSAYTLLILMSIQKSSYSMALSILYAMLRC